MMNKLLLFPLLMLILAGCMLQSPETDLHPELLTPVATRMDTALVTRGDVAEIQRFPGIVRYISQPLSFGAVSASFGMFHVREGDFVTKGQLLAQLDTDALREQIKQQEERIALMRRNFTTENRIRELDIDIMILEMREIIWHAANYHDAAAFAQAKRKELQIERQVMELEMAKELQSFNIRREEVNLQNMKNRVEGFYLHAPFDGLITRTINFSWVASFTAVIFIAHADQQGFVEYIGVPDISVGRAVRIRGHLNGNEYDLSRVVLNRQQQIYYWGLGVRLPVRFSMENAPPVGTFMPIYVYVHWEEDVLRIPRNALLASPDYGFFTYRIEDGTLNKVLLSIGAITNTFVAVHYGLEEGDVVYVR